jgi:hypothetical protein
VGRSSRSATSPPADPPSWLELTYGGRRRRTVDLVERSVNALLKAGQPISLATVAARSRAADIDPAERGVSESAILTNVAARVVYETHRTWQRAPRPRQRLDRGTSTLLPRFTPHRDAARARQRYVRWDRPALAERLVALEHAYADLEQRFARTTSELLTWMVITAHVCALYAQSDQTIQQGGHA